MDELGRISPEEFRHLTGTESIVVLDNLRSLQNIGSVFRTCDAFGIKKVYLCGITATPPHREIQRTALGATESVEWQYYENSVDCVRDLINDGYRIVSIEQTHKSKMLGAYEEGFENRTAFVLGNEVNGVDEQILALSYLHLEIPQKGTKHSLNVAVAAGIVLWETCGKGKTL